jgi:hypothetical protein
MKIGDVEVKKIPANENITCEECGVNRATKYLNGTPYCADCLLAEQQRMWEQGGNFFTTIDGGRVYFDVAERWTVREPIN